MVKRCNGCGCKMHGEYCGICASAQDDEDDDHHGEPVRNLVPVAAAKVPGPPGWFTAGFFLLLGFLGGLLVGVAISAQHLR